MFTIRFRNIAFLVLLALSPLLGFQFGATKLQVGLLLSVSTTALALILLGNYLDGRAKLINFKGRWKTWPPVYRNDVVQEARYPVEFASLKNVGRLFHQDWVFLYRAWLRCLGRRLRKTQTAS
ncbi:hypothetical protein KKB83_01095 [Patescibacteria group bacterium]|nr:hypothetical protein [Patescibacteria group bacterium]